MKFMMSVNDDTYHWLDVKASQRNQSVQEYLRNVIADLKAESTPQ